MKFGVCIPHYGRPIDVDGLTDMAVKAEEMGFDSVWVTDHIIVPLVVPGRPDVGYYARDDMLEPLTVLAHLGAVTKRVNIGTSIIVLPYRNPVVLAKAIATADVLSKGRVIFGAAIGWMEGEFQALRAPFVNRSQVSEEYLRLLKELWTNPRPTFQGDDFHVSDVAFSPMPVQNPHPPIWIGGKTHRGVRRAVEYGDFWHPSDIGPEDLSRKAAYMREYSASAGREVPPQLSFRGNLSFSDTHTPGERAPLQGTTDEIIADLQAYAEAGVSHTIIKFYSDTYTDDLKYMERFLNEVKPHVPP